MKDYYFKTPDRASFIQDLESLDLDFTKPDEEGEETVLNTQSDRHLLHYIGKFEITPGEYDEEGEQITAPVLSDYEIANLRLNPRKRNKFSLMEKDEAALQALCTAIEEAEFTHGTELIKEAPTTPVSEFAGGMVN